MKASKSTSFDLVPRSIMLRFAVSIALPAYLCSLGWSQTLLYQFDGNPGDIMNGVRGAGDVNKDGFDDVIARGSATGAVGVVRVYSGRDGSILHAWQGTATGQLLGASVAGAGDVNGDGHADLILGAMDGPNGHLSGSARVYSGKDGTLLHWFHGDAHWDRFASVDGAGDVNGDGYADLIVGGPYNDAAGPDFGIVKVFSGFDGSILHVFYGTETLEEFGISVAGIGDVNGDGFDDVAVGAPAANTIQGNQVGRITVFSGLDGSILYTKSGQSAMANFGSGLASAGDVNGDGIPDLIVGAWRHNGGIGMVQVLSGSNGSVLYEWHGSDAYPAFGVGVAGMGDLDGDGYPDLGVTSYAGSGTGTALFFSGKDGSLLYTLDADALGHGVLSVDGAGDVTGNGYGDIVVGGYNVVSVLSGHEHIVPFCLGDGSGAACPCGNPGGTGEGCANSSGTGAILAGTGSASISNGDLGFVASQLLPGQPALFFYGANAVNGGSGALFGDGLRCTGGSVLRLGIELPDAGGGALFDLDLAALGALEPGDRARFQVWYRDPVAGPCGFGFNLTNGVEVAFSW